MCIGHQRSDLRAEDTEWLPLSSTYRSTAADKEATAPQIAAQIPSDKSDTTIRQAPVSGPSWEVRLSDSSVGSVQSK
jgi:hypothetical protein